MSYDRESYWNDVASNIRDRGEANIIAGDDEPYYRYKRELFLQLFHSIDFKGKSVLEIGSGPGGNLYELSSKGCSRIVGVDISSHMIELSTRLLQGKNIELKKIDGVHLPFDDKSFDIVFTSTVLQHNTDESQLQQLAAEISRVTKSQLILFERIEKTIKGHQTNTGRPVDFYAALFSPFKLSEIKFLKIQASYFVCGIIRKAFNSGKRKEGASLSRLSHVLESATLPVTKVLDRILPSERDLAMLRFERK